MKTCEEYVLQKLTDAEKELKEQAKLIEKLNAELDSKDELINQIREAVSYDDESTEKERICVNAWVKYEPDTFEAMKKLFNI